LILPGPPTADRSISPLAVTVPVNVGAVRVKPAIVATVVPDGISVEPSVGAEYELVVLIATQADPDQTPITPVIELKYNAPTKSVLPSLSTVGAVDLAPR